MKQSTLRLLCSMCAFMSGGLILMKAGLIIIVHLKQELCLVTSKAKCFLMDPILLLLFK